jgi:hypothetical protein
MYNWTKEETELLKGIKSDNDFDRVALLVNRTRDAVKTKANRMGIYSYPELTIYHDKIPTETKAYLSGHFDGEGCIRMSAKYSGKLTQRLVISINCCNLAVLQLYAKYFNGSISSNKTFTNKPLYVWFLIKNNDLYNFIESVLPFSIEKKRQLELGKEWLLKRAEQRKTVALSEDFIKYSNEVASHLKQLKKL